MIIPCLSRMKFSAPQVDRALVWIPGCDFVMPTKHTSCCADVAYSCIIVPRLREAPDVVFLFHGSALLVRELRLVSYE